MTVKLKNGVFNINLYLSTVLQILAKKNFPICLPKNNVPVLRLLLSVVEILRLSGGCNSGGCVGDKVVLGIVIVTW